MRSQKISVCANRVILQLPRWQRSGGRDFVFYQPHPGFGWGSEAETAVVNALVCDHFQWATMLVAEQGQRWQCASYNPRCVQGVPSAQPCMLPAMNPIPCRISVKVALQ